MSKIKKILSLALVMMLAGVTTITQAQYQRPYSTDDRNVQQLIRRIETRADNFRTSLGDALDNSRLDNTRREESLNQLVSDFEQATNQLHDRFNARQSATSDVQTVLDRAARIDRFMQRSNLASDAERQWSLLKDDLNTLAGYYNVAWNWSDAPRNNFPQDNAGAGGRNNAAVNDRWTGTFRLNTSQSEDARVAVDRALGNLPTNQRQQAYNRLLARLEAPEMIALERQGRTITLASSRAPQTTFEADGRENVEQYPNSTRTSRVRATLNRGQFTIESTGDRATDFTVTFEPLDRGNRLRVTRRLYAERLGQPVVVQSVYDRVSDVAQWNVHTGTPNYPSAGQATDGFIIPDGAALVARLDTDLDTNRTRAGDRFTLTVLSPSQFEGATIEGVVGNIDRGGRISGRTEMALNLNQIRMPNGQTYRFDGVIESVRTANGETVNLDTEGRVREDDSQTERTVKRGAIGAAVGAIIGAIAGGGKGAAIGAVLGGGAGAGSVYVQGRNDLQLMSGSELTIRAVAPRAIR